MVQAPFIAGGRKIHGPASDDPVDGLGHNTVLKDRLRKVDDIVHDDLTTEDITQVEDILSKLRLAISRRSKAERRPRSQIVHDFEHGRTLTLPYTSLPWQHHHRRQVARRLQLSQKLHAVGEDANPRAAAIHTGRGA